MLDYVIGCRLSLWRSGRGRVCVRTRVCLCVCVVCNCKVCLCVVGGDVCVCARERAYALAPACLTSTRTSWQRGPSDGFSALLTRQVLGSFQRRQLNAFPAPACHNTVPLNTHSVHWAQKRSWVGRWSWAEQVGHLLLRVVQVVRQQRCNGHCLSDCPAQQLKEQLRSAQVAGQWRGDTALTLPLFWRRSTVSPVFFGRFPRSSLSLSRPLPTLSPSLIGQLASVDVKQR